jgi:hypothetical protein
MGYKQRRSVTSTPVSSSLSLDGKRFGNDPKIVQEPERNFLRRRHQDDKLALFEKQALSLCRGNVSEIDLVQVCACRDIRIAAAFSEVLPHSINNRSRLAQRPQSARHGFRKRVNSASTGTTQFVVHLLSVRQEVAKWNSLTL